MKKTIAILLGVLFLSACTVSTSTTTTTTTTTSEDGSEIVETSVSTWSHTQTSEESEVMGVYEGEATIKGWIVTKDFFNAETSFFRVSEDSYKDLPVEVQNLINDRPEAEFQDCSVQKNGEDAISLFTNSSSSNPETIVIDKVMVPIEGAISLNIKN